MRIDPEATLRSWAVEVDLVDRTWTIPALPASAWLEAILAGTWTAIVPGLIETSDDLDDLIADGALDTGECVAAARAALAAASGTAWWSAVKLAQSVMGSWVGGDLLLHGADPARMPLGAYLAAAWRAATRNMDEQKTASLELEMDAPPQDVSPEEWWDDDEAARSFGAAMSAPGR